MSSLPLLPPSPSLHSTSSGAGYIEDVDPKLEPCILGREEGGGDARGETRHAPPPPPPPPSSASEISLPIARQVQATTPRRQLALEWKGECSELLGITRKRQYLYHEKGDPDSLPPGSILARKSYLRTLADPARIPPEPALTNNERRSKLEVRARIKLVGGRPWSPGVYSALRLLGNTLEVAWERAFIRASHF